MRVREVMSSPVVTVPPGMPLKAVAKLLVARGISAVPVVDSGGLVGILSEADLVPLELAPDPRAHLALVSGAPASTSRVASEAMTRDVVALPEEADVADAGRLMLERRIKSIPVLRAAGSSASWPGGTCWRYWHAATRRSPVTWRRCSRPNWARQAPTR